MIQYFSQLKLPVVLCCVPNLSVPQPEPAVTVMSSLNAAIADKDDALVEEVAMLAPTHACAPGNALYHPALQLVNTLQPLEVQQLSFKMLVSLKM